MAMAQTHYGLLCIVLVSMSQFTHGQPNAFPLCPRHFTLFDVVRGAAVYAVENESSSSLPSITCCIPGPFTRDRFNSPRQPYPASFWYHRDSLVSSIPGFNISKLVTWVASTRTAYNYRTIVWPSIITKSVAGLYSCSYPELGLAKNLPLSYFHLIVGKKPKIAFITRSMTVMSTSWKIGSLRLLCRASGSSPVTYTWTKDGVALASRKGAYGFGGVVSVSDSGTYTCSVSNPFGRATGQLYLRVLDIPRFWRKPVPAMIMSSTLLAKSVRLRLVPPSSTGDSPITSYEVTC
eukprot:scpid89379/ scgid28235/ 